MYHFEYLLNLNEGQNVRNSATQCSPQIEHLHRLCKGKILCCISFDCALGFHCLCLVIKLKLPAHYSEALPTRMSVLFTRGLVVLRLLRVESDASERALSRIE